MFKSFITITFRGLSKQGIFTIVNILGLSIGLMMVLLMSLLNFYERSFDRSFENSKNIYRINAVADDAIYATGANKLGPTMQGIPEVVTTVRTHTRYIQMLHNENGMKLHVLYVDEDYFSLFETPIILGRAEDVFAHPKGLAISEQEAKRIFGNDDPIGQKLVNTYDLDKTPMEIVAVYKDYPENSSFNHIKIICSFMHSWEPQLYRILNWTRAEFETFCLLTANANIAAVEKKMSQAILDDTNGEGADFEPQLQRLTDLYLQSTNILGKTTFFYQSDIKKVKMLSLLSIVILLVACVNYMNLSTARAQKRSREIGISKTVGASQFELLLRITLETAFLVLISFIVALLLARILLPFFNELVGQQLNLNMALQPYFLIAALLIWLITTLLAASYPALYISSFPPLTAIRSQSMPKSSHAMVRKILTVGQFAVAIVLIAWVLVLQGQIKFINNKDLGYDPRNVIGFWIEENVPPALIDELRALSSVEMVSLENQGVFHIVRPNRLHRDPDDQTGLQLTVRGADPNYIDLMQMKLIAGSVFQDMTTIERITRDTVIQGRTFTYSTLADMNTYVVLNRAAVDYLGMTPEEAIGQRVIAQIDAAISPNPIICGVIENFHFESLHRPVGGYCIHYGPSGQKRYVVLRMVEGNVSEQLQSYAAIYNKFFPTAAFAPDFFDQKVADFYINEHRSARISVIFSILAIFVACMGVFGLTAFMAEQRVKEIGVRKVMGANTWNVVSLFTSSYLKLLGISLLIALPIAWWVGNRFLENFAFRISINWWVFVVAALITTALTLLTVSVLALKSAMKDPVKSIKTE